MSVRKASRRAFAGVFAFALASFGSGSDQAAHAQTVSPADAGASRTDGGAQPDRPVIRVGRALDFEGRPVFSGQTRFSSTAAISTASLSPMAPRYAGTAIALPTSAPLLQGTLTSSFGMRRHPILGGARMHAGIDLAAASGSPVRATSDGVVGMAGWGGGYGLTVRLEHAGGLETRYGHLSGLAVATGQSVRRGDVIGFVGSTGLSTGPHLHYELRSNGVPIRPF